MVSRVVRAAVLVSVLSSLALAAVAALTARILWQEYARRSLSEAAGSLALAIQHEAAEGRLSIEQAAPAAIEETPALGYRVEVWKGSALVARNTSGRLLGPFPLAEDSPRASPWIFATRRLPGGAVVAVALAKQQGLQSMRIFTRSLLLSLPLCLLLAILVGRHAGRRAARPLAEFTDQIARVRELRRPRLAAVPNAPAEVRALERAFREVLARLARTLSRELEFAGNASHELRTPLTRIRLHAERALAEAGPLAAAELRELLSEIDQLVRLIDALLVLARDVEAGIPAGEGVNLADLVRERVRRVFAGSAAPGLEAPDEALVRGDEDLLSVAVENLLDNAKKYTPAGRKPSVRVAENGTGVEFTVLSPDVHIPEDARDRLFERFFRGEEARVSHGGSGLGLSLARHIAELHGGTLFCDQEDREGVRFVMVLPPWTPDASGTD